ncbi:MAG TPA: SAM-dependent methyltransferase [Actinoplanes sp.]|nr:SAM-dependent methyltransferase [Actinoplanes sp.]
MPRYAMLLAPSANRVYADGAGRLSHAELTVFAGAGVLDAAVDDIVETTIGGVGYLAFGAGAPLTERDVAYLSNLSSAYALFEVVGDELLRPLTMAGLARYDSDLITIPKYAGKTNEQFTKLLLNLTILCSASAPRMLDTRLTVLDPLCGRGTTLNQALMYGYDAIGVEIDGKDVEAYAAFLKTWLKRKRLKHSADVVPVRRDRKLVARRLEVTMAASKSDHKAGAVQQLTVLHADTTKLDGILRGGVADVIVADAPYGVAHGSVTDSGGLSRRPLDLLERAVPQWVPLLRRGGALGLSWNVNVAKRVLAEDILLAAGLEIIDLPELAHRVDQSIERDVLIARKPD